MGIEDAVRPHKKTKIGNDGPKAPLKSALKNSASKHPPLATAEPPKKNKKVAELTETKHKHKTQVQKDKVKTKPARAVNKGKGKATADDGESIAHPEEEASSMPPTSFKVIVGSYEKLLYGLEGTLSYEGEGSSQELKSTLKPIFIFPAHVACVKAVAASPMGGKWLATGSADEIIKVWDLRRKKEVGGLIQHEGTRQTICAFCV